MIETSETFKRRTRRVSRRREKMLVNGYRARIGRDGLITQVPRMRRPTFPLQGVLIVFAAALAYKSILYAWLGEIVYQSRIEALAEGTWIERAGAWVLQADPVTLAIASVIRTFLPV